ncbi:hypothetical protein NMY22_g14842 [Coprinellus aureogranulatus]|nr:hypothetical protein NMY22_g14842 [Coprinellus aureogranulatus]
MTTRNRIPRSRATSLARSRVSSRASSVSGSRVASVAGSVAGSRPGSRAGMRDIWEGSSGTVHEGLNWQPGRDMDLLDDELWYVGASSSGGAEPSGSGHWATGGEPPPLAPMSSKAKGKKRARSTPESEIEGHDVARTRPRVGSPQEELPYTQDFAPTFHDQAYTFHPTTFSFTTQTPVDERPPTQPTISSSSSGSLTLASTTTLVSSASVRSASSAYPPPFSSFDNYNFDSGTMTEPPEGAGSSSAPTEPPLASSKGKAREIASESARGSSAKRGSFSEEAGGSNGDSSSSNSTQAGSSSSSSTEASSSSSSATSAASSSTVVPLPSRPPRPPTPPPQPDLLSSYTCPICFFPPSNATLTPCGHICCGSCLFTAIKSSQLRNGMGFAHSTFATHGEALCPLSLLSCIFSEELLDPPLLPCDPLIMCVGWRRNPFEPLVPNQEEHGFAAKAGHEVYTLYSFQDHLQTSVWQSRSINPGMSTIIQQSPLLSLPTELLDKIIEECLPDWSLLLRLRLVCSFLNVMATPKAVPEALHFWYGESDFDFEAKALIDLGPSAFDAHFETLKFYPYYKEDDDAPDLVSSGVEDLIIGILERTKAVTGLIFRFSGNVSLTARMIQAIGQLPLSDLKLENLQGRQLTAPLIGSALTSPQELHELFFEWQDCSDQYSSQAQDQARAFIAACPNLESVEIRRLCNNGTECAVLDSQLDFRTSSTVLPSPTQHLRTCRLTTRYLSGLTCLHISNAEPGLQGLWRAFQSYGVELLELRVYAITEPLAAYLSGYKALRWFDASAEWDPPVNKPAPGNGAVSMRALWEALANHSDTLERIWLIPPDDMLLVDPLGAERRGFDSEGDAAMLKQFTKIKSLKLVILAGEDGIPDLHFFQLHTLGKVVLRVIKDTVGREPETDWGPFFAWERKATGTLYSVLLNGFQMPACVFHPGRLQLVLRVIERTYSPIPVDVWIEKDARDDTYRFKTEGVTMRLFREYL